MNLSTSGGTRTFGAVGGIVLDQLFGEPAPEHHPLVHFGRIMNAFEAANYRDTRLSGIVHSVAGVTLGALAGKVIGSTAVATGLAIGGRSLLQAAADVRDALSQGDLAKARLLLPSLVGRDPSNLDELEISRATVESVAENTVDAIVAPALVGAVSGAPGVLAYRAINTMDAMVGHHSTRYDNYGWASARMDDIANWIPARCTAGLVALVRPAAAWDIGRSIRLQAPDHPSPNSGVAEAAFAAALGVQLGGRNVYDGRVEDRPVVGFGRPTQCRDITQAIRLSRDVTLALAVLLSFFGIVQSCRQL
jgi:adenosylcobinamide-phosphate synthase